MVAGEAGGVKPLSRSISSYLYTHARVYRNTISVTRTFVEKSNTNGPLDSRRQPS